MKRILVVDMGDDRTTVKTRTAQAYSEQRDIRSADIERLFMDIVEQEISVDGEMIEISYASMQGAENESLGWHAKAVFYGSERDIVLLLFSVIQRESYENIREIYIEKFNRVTSHYASKPLLVLGACDIDLRDPNNKDHVTSSETQALGKEINADACCEYSVETNIDGLNEMFIEAARLYILHKKKKASGNKSAFYQSGESAPLLGRNNTEDERCCCTLS